MKTSTTLIAALAVSFAASGAALAQEATYEYPQAVVSTVTRAAVQADLAQARADGTLRVTEADFNRHTPSVTHLSRGAVKAELLAAIASGELQRLNRDHNGFDAPALATPAVVMTAAN
jgi:hypothetical protein